MRHYGLEEGQRGTHFLMDNDILEVVGFDSLDNNRAKFRVYGGDRHGREVWLTAEHFEESPKDENCPTCGEPVYTIFDHLGEDC